MRVFKSICYNCGFEKDVVSVADNINTSQPIFRPYCLECLRTASWFSSICRGCDNEKDVISIACHVEASNPFSRPYCWEYLKKMYENDDDFSWEDYLNDEWNEN